MERKADTILGRLLEQDFPPNLLRDDVPDYLQPLTQLILSSHIVKHRAGEDWQYKSLEQFGQENFVVNGHGFHKDDWPNRAIQFFSESVYRWVWSEEHEGLVFHVRDAEQFRPARPGDPAYDHVCRLRGDGSLSDLFFYVAPSWAKELFIYRPNWLAYQAIWCEVDSLRDPKHSEYKAIRASAVAAATLQYETSLKSGVPIVGHQNTIPAVPEDVAWDGGFNVDHLKYPMELDIAFQAWRALCNSNSSDAPRKQLMQWLKRIYPGLSQAAVERIAGICNWDRTGGRPKSE